MSKNISRYYISKTARDRPNNTLGTTFNSGNQRYAKSNFNVTFNETVMVGPDTLACRLNGQVHEVDSVGALYKNIQTSILLCNSLLKTDSFEIR